MNRYEAVFNKNKKHVEKRMGVLVILLWKRSRLSSRSAKFNWNMAMPTQTQHAQIQTRTMSYKYIYISICIIYIRCIHKFLALLLNREMSNCLKLFEIVWTQYAWFVFSSPFGKLTFKICCRKPLANTYRTRGIYTMEYEVTDQVQDNKPELLANRRYFCEQGHTRMHII